MGKYVWCHFFLKCPNVRTVKTVIREKNNKNRDFPAIQNLGPGALDFGKKLCTNLSNWENLIESLKQYVNILAFLLPAQQSIASFFVVNCIYYK